MRLKECLWSQSFGVTTNKCTFAKNWGMWSDSRSVRSRVGVGIGRRARDTFFSLVAAVV
jgi:hypothetical protein